MIEPETLFLAPLNVELLPHIRQNHCVGMGVRVRPYGKGWPRDVMVLGYGVSVQQALDDALDQAQAEKWQNLDWASRPWPQEVIQYAGFAKAPTSPSRRAKTVAGASETAE